MNTIYFLLITLLVTLSSSQQPQVAPSVASSSPQPSPAISDRFLFFPSVVKYANLRYSGMVLIEGQQFNITNGNLQYKPSSNGSRSRDSFSFLKDSKCVNVDRLSILSDKGKLDIYTLVHNDCYFYEFNSQKGDFPRCRHWIDRGNRTYSRSCQVLLHYDLNQNENQYTMPANQSSAPSSQSARNSSGASAPNTNVSSNNQSQLNFTISTLVVVDDQNRLQNLENVVIDEYGFPLVAKYMNAVKHQGEPEDSVFQIPTQCAQPAVPPSFDTVIFGTNFGLSQQLQEQLAEENQQPSPEQQ